MLLLLLACSTPSPNHDDNGIWGRRTWLYENPDDAQVEALIQSLRARGITRFYPFLGPPDASGHPGWREGDQLHPVDFAKASAFLTKMHEKAPELAVYPWTGGVYQKDIFLDDSARLNAWMEQVLQLPVTGVQLNIEPMPEQEAYLALLREWKQRLGTRTLSIAAYPPPTPLHPYGDVHWSLPFLQKVCDIADDLAVMTYDTGLNSPAAYTRLLQEWTTQLATLPPPEQGGCTLRIGVPTYEEERPYHHPEAETLPAALAGIRLAMPLPAHIRGVALYASWTTDREEWTVYDRNWRQVAPVDAPAIDGGF